MPKTSAVLLIAVLLLCGIGVAMLASTGEAPAMVLRKPPNYFLTRQLLWLGIAVVAGVVATAVDYHVYRWAAIPIALVALGLLWYTSLFAPVIKGSRRWISVAGLTVQPSEFAKLAAVMFLAAWFRWAQPFIGRFWRALVPPGIVCGAMLLALLKAPDFGAMILLGLLIYAILFVAGVPLFPWIWLGITGAVLSATAVWLRPEKMIRVTSFWEYEKYAWGPSYQLVCSLQAFVAGGLVGLGFGQSLEKRLHLPEAHTDFIFSILGEEFGLVGTLTVLALFAVVMLCGFAIARRAPDIFGRLLAYGLTLSITLQALVNIGVVTASLPTTGLALPFISYGGTNLLINFASVGILLNIARHAEEQRPDDHASVLKNRVQEI